MEDLCKVSPPNIGWLQAKLAPHEKKLLWEYINEAKKSHKQYLAGQISDSLLLTDKENLFFNNVLLPLCHTYSAEFYNRGVHVPVTQDYPYYLETLWVNYQNEFEFNPAHSHRGVYSFVAWLNIPTQHATQQEHTAAKNSRTPLLSSFQFQYTNILGEICNYNYKQDPEDEGTILFFPAELVHSVYPFFNCKETRVSVSGNIGLNTSFTTNV